ncbi:Transcriptional regulator, DeoR family [Myxococcus hansupus]|uniref:Transcriptional regulator, DeoR family n=1 Tax=Pseudomyxococcus hansupus TaxID=1297742 RepID=A0A0H4WTA3_9BACT|nr:YafY family protein [Myxococcus hansupus]AKQ66019.1 Transcriptional regulator, DeoR family [Myxococcus hansupus]
MDRILRLFGLMDSLRRHRSAVTAQVLAEEHQVSIRTVYRDIQMLQALGAPIGGEAGLGYVLLPGFFLPPLMFSVEELEALVLGARWVEQLPDSELASAATNALAKLSAAVPEELAGRIDDTGLWPVMERGGARPSPLLGLVRRAMREERGLFMRYQNQSGEVSERVVLPVQLAYFQERQVFVAWCFKRNAFARFRLDRVQHAELSEQRFHRPRVELARQWFEEFEAQLEQALDDKDVP